MLSELRLNCLLLGLGGDFAEPGFAGLFALGGIGVPEGGAKIASGGASRSL